MYSFILCDLEALYQPFLTGPCVPYWGPIGEDWDDEGVVDFLPVEEVKAIYRVAEEADASDGGSCACGHDGDVLGPIESVA